MSNEETPYSRLWNTAYNVKTIGSLMKTVIEEHYDNRMEHLPKMIKTAREKLDQLENLLNENQTTH